MWHYSIIIIIRAFIHYYYARNKADLQINKFTVEIILKSQLSPYYLYQFFFLLHPVRTDSDRSCPICPNNRKTVAWAECSVCLYGDEDFISFPSWPSNTRPIYSSAVIPLQTLNASRHACLPILGRATNPQLCH